MLASVAYAREWLYIINMLWDSIASTATMTHML